MWGIEGNGDLSIGGGGGGGWGGGHGYCNVGDAR